MFLCRMPSTPRPMSPQLTGSPAAGVNRLLPIDSVPPQVSLFLCLLAFPIISEVAAPAQPVADMLQPPHPRTAHLRPVHMVSQRAPSGRKPRLPTVATHSPPLGFLPACLTFPACASPVNYLHPSPFTGICFGGDCLSERVTSWLGSGLNTVSPSRRESGHRIRAFLAAAA